jgi:hypothetical protein
MGICASSSTLPIKERDKQKSQVVPVGHDLDKDGPRPSLSKMGQVLVSHNITETCEAAPISGQESFRIGVPSLPTTGEEHTALVRALLTVL